MTDAHMSEQNQTLDHSQRLPMLEELHARPFLKLNAPNRLAFLALKPEEDGTHTTETSRIQLIDFLDHFGAEHPEEGAVFYFVELGGMILKWENHSEFATYTLFSSRQPDVAPDETCFSGGLHSHFTDDWILRHSSRIISSVSARIEQVKDLSELQERVSKDVPEWFGKGSTFAAAYVSDHTAAVAADFELDANGCIRFAMLASDAIGPGRTGRAVQRFLEIETYRAMSMLTLPVARLVLDDLGRIDGQLARTVEAMGDKTEQASESLDELLRISADLALLSSRSSFRFSAARAYEALVMQRIELLREERLLGRQLFSEFMKRRYTPPMRTCRSAHQQLVDMTQRAAKASELLGTRVSVTTAEQNRKLLAKMDTRAAQQARLQETVEGISVVAISYYAVSLLTYLLAPLTKVTTLDKTTLAALLVLPVAGLVWFTMHRLKEKLIRVPGDSNHKK